MGIRPPRQPLLLAVRRPERLLPLTAYPARRPARLPRIDGTRPLHAAEQREMGRSEYPLSTVVEADVTRPISTASQSTVVVNTEIALSSRR